MIYGTHFVFNGYDSRDLGLFLCSIGDDGENEINMGLDLEVINFEKNGKFYDYGAKHKDVLTFNMTVVTCDKHPLSREEIRKYMRIFDDYEEFKWLTVYDGDDKEYNYYCRIISKVKYKYGGNIIGLTFGVQCDSQYAYSELKEINLLNPYEEIIGAAKRYTYNHSLYLDSDVQIEPIFKFNYQWKRLGETNENSNVSITLYEWNVNNKNSFPMNLTVVPSSFRDPITDGKGYLLIDCENQCVFSDRNEYLSYKANPQLNLYDFPVFHRGVNNIKIVISSTIESVTILYREKYKIGEF